MVLALAAIQRGNVRRMRIWLLARRCSASLFLGGQAFEFTRVLPRGPARSHTNMFGTTFFVLTGFHGAHVTVGVLILHVALGRARCRGSITQENSLNVELAGLYWHFVDIVWIIIFTLVYLVTQ